MDNHEIQTRFIELLIVLTNSNTIEWARSKADPGFVYGLTGDDLIIFEVRGNGKGGIVDPSGIVNGIVSKYRNVSYLWLEPTPRFGDLLELLRRAPIDDEKFIQFRRRALMAPIKALEAYLA
jgi:hypothetical protein